MKEGKREKSNQAKIVKSILREVILLNISNNSLSVNAMSLTSKPIEGQGNTNQGQLPYTDDARSLETHVPFH